MSIGRLPLGVIIVSWNVSGHLSRCLQSLVQALAVEDVEAEVWVVDNASSDDSVAMVRRDHPWVTLLPQSENLGYARANNVAIAAALGKADAIWLLNPDTVVPPGTISTLLTFLDQHPRAGLIGPKLLNSDGTLQECAFRFPGLSQALFAVGGAPDRLYHTALNGRYPPTLFEQETAFQIDHPLGAAMLARTDTVRDVGPLDEGYFMYCEEIDWAWRMHKAGWQRWLMPSVTVTHFGGASSGQARPATTAHLWESRARLYRKHQTPMTYALAGALVRRTFRARRSSATSEEWRAAYGRILTAWQTVTAGARMRGNQ